MINPSGAGVDALRIAEAEDKVEFVKTEAEKALQKIEERIAARASSAGTPTGEELIREQLDYNPTYPNAPKEITVDIGKQAVGIFSDALETSTYLQNQLRDYQGDTSNFYLINKTRLSPEDFLTQYGIDINMFRGRVIDAADRSSDDIAAALLGPLQEKKITRMKVIANNAADILALSTLSRNSQIELLMLNLSDKSFEIISNSTELHKKYMDVHAKTLKAA